MSPRLHPLWVSALMGIMLCVAAPLTRASHVEISIRSDAGLFYEHLSQYGQWLNDDRYGLVWSPSATPPGWRPYSMGHWMNTGELGWLWSSDWSWGWATFHYGRWFYRADHGWCWVPGIQWAPAWVAWRIGNGVIGWAPLPPEARWRAEGSLADGADVTARIPEFAWTFVKLEDFTRDKLLPLMIPGARNITLWQHTRDITRYGRLGEQVVNHGPDVARVGRAAPGKIIPHRIVDVTFPKGEQATRVRDDQVAVFRPHLTLDNEVPEPAPNQPPDSGFSLTQIETQHKPRRKALEHHQAAERAELVRLHDELRRAPPAGTSPAQIARWVDQEQRALAEHHEMETTVLNKRLARELEPYARPR